ncbi:MAG: LAGLIDADG family homing endonuclease [Candidatus Neomarinimicrobiota bacterium]|jgi:replicative DNA helicase
MTTWENQLLSRVIRTGDINSVLRWGITYEDFNTSEGRMLFMHLVNYYQLPETSGSILGPASLQQSYPTFQIVDDPCMTIDALCTEVRKNRFRTDLRMMLQNAEKLIDVDPAQALNLVSSTTNFLQQLGTTRKLDVHAIDAMNRIMQRYEMKERGVDLSICAWPWEPLQEATGGIEPDDYVIIYGRPKCVPLGTEILAADGSLRAVEEATSVVGLHHDTRRLTPQSVTGRSEVVRKRVVRITTKTGYEVQVGEDHPILRPSMAYTEAQKLQVGDYVGTARRLRLGEEQGDPRWYELLGLLTGDGNYTRNEVQFTCFDKGVLHRAGQLAQAFGCTVQERNAKEGAYSVKRAEGQATNPILDKLRYEGVHGSKSTEKKVPVSLFTKDGGSIAAFLGGLLSTDGGVYRSTVRWNTSSKKLAQQVKHLLLRLGIVGSLGEVTTNIGTSAYTINVMSAEQHEAVLREMGAYISSEHKLLQLLNNCSKGGLRKRHNDSIPHSKELEDAILQARERNGGWAPLWGKFSHNKLFRRSGCISRGLLQKLAFGMKASELLKWADDDIFWDRVVAVEPLGEMDCIDISVSGDHNFLVGDVITHNSMKSWVLAYLIAWVYELGKRPLIYTKEMTPDNIIARVVAIMASIRYHEFRRGRLSPVEKDSLYASWRVLHHLKEMQSMVCLSGKDAGEGGDTVPWLRSKVEQYKPDLVFIDGLYLMSNARSGRKAQKDNERVRDISRDLSQMRLDTGVPVLATIQANRDAAKNNDANLDEVAFSDAIGQDATLAMRVINDKNEPTLSLVVGGSREFYLDGFSIYGVPATNFSYAGPLTAGDVQRAKDADGEPGAKKARKKTKVQQTEEGEQLHESAARWFTDLQRPG